MPTQHDETLLERYQREELEHEYYMAKRIAELEAEVLRLKTVPMKYRRMQFNAELQEQVAELEAKLSGVESDAYTISKDNLELQKQLMLAKDVIENAVVMVAHQDNIDYLQEALATINDSEMLKGLIVCDAEPVGAVLVRRENREGIMFYSADMIPKADTIKDRFELITVYALRATED